jgi:predicted flap endonuclease-1-like 5' DNA nuclease
MTKLTELESISAANAAKLEKAGIKSVEGLLEAGATGKGRAALVEQTKVKEDQLMGWINRADLCRVKGIGTAYAVMLEKVGVMTLADLAKSKPAVLHKALEDAAAKKKKDPRPAPSLKNVEKWVMGAKELPKVVKK